LLNPFPNRYSQLTFAEQKDHSDHEEIQTITHDSATEKEQPKVDDQ
jgi:hypothetical protein